MRLKKQLKTSNSFKMCDQNLNLHMTHKLNFLIWHQKTMIGYISGTNGIKIKSYICDPNLNRNKLSNKKIKLEVNFKHAAKNFIYNWPK